jgi:hypothetical protein
MTRFNCNFMRTAIVIAGGLLLLAILLLSPVLLMAKPLPDPLVWLVYPGFAALVSSPLVMLFTALITLAPSVNSQLQNCQH